MNSSTRRYLHLPGAVLVVVLALWLADLQLHAADVVASQPEEDRVRWQLDGGWFVERGVTLQA